MDSIFKENTLSFLGYATVLIGGASLAYYLLANDVTILDHSRTMSSLIVSLGAPRSSTISSTKQLKKMVARLSSSSSCECVILLREIVWSSHDVPKCYLVWKGKPSTVYQYSIGAPGMEPIIGIYDDMNENVFYKVALPILFENGVIYHVKISDASSIH